MNDKNREHLPQHKTVLNHTSEEQLAGFLGPNIDKAHAAGVSASPASEKPRRLSTAITLVPSGKDISAAGASASPIYEKPKGISAAGVSASPASEKPRRLSTAITLVPSGRDISAAGASASPIYEKPKGISAAGVSALPVYGNRARVPEAPGPKLSRYENPRMITTAATAPPSVYENLRGISTAIISPPSTSEHLRDRSTAITSPPSVYENLRGISTAITGRTIKAHQYPQKQVTLESPNIIRSGLSVNRSCISTPEKRRAPLVEPPPIATIGEVYDEIPSETIFTPFPELVPITDSEKVFIVHGHDHASRDTVADFVDNWGLKPIVLDKQPNKGRTIIEKFEDLADETSFAIVLLTPDDVGGTASAQHSGDLGRRARQNVILELGYFLKAVGRPKVCILYKEGVELPSDIHGLLYIPMDDADEWKEKVIREMVEAKVLANANKI